MWRKTNLDLANLLRICIAQKSANTGKLLHAHIVRTGLSSHTFLSNRLIELYSKCRDLRAARQVFDEMPERNFYSWNALLSGFCADKLDDAHKLFDEMPERNVVSWNNMISSFVKNGDDCKALGLFSLMVSEGFVPTRFTLASILSACGVSLELYIGRLCHGLAVKVGVDGNMYVGNSLLSMYAKCRCVDDAIFVFEHLPEPNEVSFTALMGGLAETYRFEEAFKMFKLMQRTKVCIDAMSLSSILGVCARGKDHCYSLCKLHGRLVHGVSVKLGFENDLHLGNSLLDMYAKNGDMGSAEVIFQNLFQLNVVSWNIMIDGYGKMNRCDKVMELMERMRYSGCQPDEVTFINMMAACVKSENVVDGRQFFDKMTCPSLSSWNAMLAGYLQIGKHDEAIMLFREMQFRNVMPDGTTLATVLGSCAEIRLLECGKQVHAVSIKASFESNMYVSSGLITTYSKSGKIDFARTIFGRLSELDIVCWNSMIAGLSVNGLAGETFDLFNVMRKRNMLPTQFTYATILSCCAKVSFSSQGRQIHAQIVKDGCLDDVFVGSALIDMYCKCGNVEGASQLFDAMPVKNVVVWNEMIHGYAQNGFGERALHLYRCMLTAGEKPDGVTFIAVLTACSHSGFVDEGIRILESMRIEHEVEPLLDHYTCIIDALGRSGRLHEAESLINSKVPHKDDPVIWEVLLSSCRVYTDVLVAKRAAEKLLSLNPGCSTPYVLLGNIYSSMGHWEDARAVRDLMIQKNVDKNAGYSWAETEKGSRISGAYESHLSHAQSQWGVNAGEGKAGRTVQNALFRSWAILFGIELKITCDIVLYVHNGCHAYHWCR